MYQCKYCLRFFKTNSALLRHRRSKRLCAIKTYQCNLCGLYYKDNKFLEIHKKLHCCSKYAYLLIRIYTLQWLLPLCGLNEINFEQQALYMTSLHAEFVLKSILKLQQLAHRKDYSDRQEIIQILLTLFSLCQISVTDVTEILYNL